MPTSKLQTDAGQPFRLGFRNKVALYSSKVKMKILEPKGTARKDTTPDEMVIFADSKIFLVLFFFSFLLTCICMLPMLDLPGQICRSSPSAEEIHSFPIRPWLQFVATCCIQLAGLATAVLFRRVAHQRPSFMF